MSHPEPTSPAVSPRRFRWQRLVQFRLRTLLVLTTVVAVGFAWWWHKALQQEAVAEAPRAGDACPMCGGKLTRVGDVTDDRSKASRNLAVWNRSICGNPLYRDDSIICTQCWHAYWNYMNVSLGWERSSEAADAFWLPLAAEIRQFPLPGKQDLKCPAVYSQKYVGDDVAESLAFWCADSAEALAAIRAHAGQRDLSIRVEQQGRFENQVYVAVEAKPRRKD